MTFAENVIAAARGCLGTPFHHQGRMPGVGLDCIGLIVVALRQAGMEIQDNITYARQPSAAQLQQELDDHGFIRVEAMQPGDILLFRFNRAPQHVALCTESNRMIHAYAPTGKVVECGIGTSWQNRMCGIYRLSA